MLVHLGERAAPCNNLTQNARRDSKQTQSRRNRAAATRDSTRTGSRSQANVNATSNKNARGKTYGEDASPRPVEGHAVHGRQVSQDPLVHLHVCVHGRGHQLTETVGAIQSTAEARLHWMSRKTCTLVRKDTTVQNVQM